jgi:hypothetical protein
MPKKEENMPSLTQDSAIEQKKPPSREKKRLNLELAAPAYDLLQRLADESGKNLADVLRTGLALYGIAHDAKQQGRGIGVIEGEKVVKEILLT